ncbi:chloride channel protein [Aquihabitans sp. McL0605]|uniref:chloride channel protein n=1 Tax=Aquihabitans sp. McL0605 TaxID=3415671 RepID=UPI003CF8A055
MIGPAVVVGAVTGLGVALFDRVVAVGLFGRILRAPLAVQVVVPGVGLALALICLRYLAAGASSSTADAYIENFHQRDRWMDLRPVVGRLLASAFTLGTGNAMGFEGPSIYLGASIGSAVEERATRWISRDDAKVLMVAGAAAGVAAIFKAPATGALFALEVPYQADLARRMLLPALFSAAAGYLVFVAINGTAPLFPTGGSPQLDLRDLAGAVAIGLVAGAAARSFAWFVLLAKHRSVGIHPVLRVTGAGVAIGGLILVSKALTGETLAFGPGYRTIAWAQDPHHAIGLVLGMFVVRWAATVVAVGGGGVGGLFIPLVIEGALLGRIAGGLVGLPGSTLFPVLGVAAFLGAGYRVPLAAVVFVAESTGKPGFVVPGLIAAAASQLTMGPRSVSPYQRERQPGHIEGRLEISIGEILDVGASFVPPDLSVAELVDRRLLGARSRQVPVVDGTTYIGMIGLGEITAVDRWQWDATDVGALVDRTPPALPLDATIREALAIIGDHDLDRVAITDGGAYVGVVTEREIMSLDAILGGPGDDARP